tara:strand:- start:382 stop:1494 length:1113 start_codon:yes stop_codon:yes gene_type:complete
VGPFPWHRVPRVDAAEVALRQRFARRGVPVDGEAALRALSGLIGCEVSVGSDALHVCDEGTLRAALLEPLAGIVLAPSDGAPARLAVLELDPFLASWIGERMLGGDGLAADGVSPLPDVHRGALAFAAARVAAEADCPWRIGGVLTSEEAFVAALGDRGSAVWSVELHVADAPGLGRAPRSARLWLPVSLLDTLPPAPRGAALADLPLAVAIDVGEAELEAEVLASLRPGDAIIPDRHWGADQRVRVRPLGGARSAWWCRAADGALTLEEIERTDEGPVGRGSKMDDATRTDTSEDLAAIGDAPVTLSLELARFEIGLGELASLRPGEVVVSGVPLGREVRLRAGSKVVATGELVDVEGEIGVRLIALGE